VSATSDFSGFLVATTTEVNSGLSLTTEILIWIRNSGKNMEKFSKTIKVCIICPILLTIYGGEIYGSSDQAVLNVEAQYAKDSVLILYDTDDNLRLYSTSGAVGPSEGILRFYLGMSHKFVF